MTTWIIHAVSDENLAFICCMVLCLVYVIKANYYFLFASGWIYSSIINSSLYHVLQFSILNCRKKSLYLKLFTKHVHYMRCNGCIFSIYCYLRDSLALCLHSLHIFISLQFRIKDRKFCGALCYLHFRSLIHTLAMYICCTFPVNFWSCGGSILNTWESLRFPHSYHRRQDQILVAFHKLLMFGHQYLVLLQDISRGHLRS